MNTNNLIEFLNKEAEAFLAPVGKSLYYELAGRGKLDSRMAVIWNKSAWLWSIRKTRKRI